MTAIYFLVLSALCSVIYFNDEVKADCGGIIKETNGTITSPSYPSSYPPNQDCTWEIKTTPNNRIALHFSHFHLENHSSCDYDSLTIKSKMEDGQLREHGNFCGLLIIPNIVSDSNILLIEFVSDGAVSHKGFEMEFSIVPFECGGLIEESSKIITSPLFPFHYPPNMNCTWIIQAPLSHNIKLKFIIFSTEGTNECNRDYVTVQSKMADGETREHGQFCGDKLPTHIISESNILLIQFVSNGISQFQGFKTDLSFEGCGGLFEGRKGSIKTPFYPDFYPPHKVCEWTILVPPQHKIKMNFPQFNTEEGGDDCSNDFLLVQSRTADGEIHEYGKYCGRKWSFNICSKSTILLKFVSDRSYQKIGFQAEYIIDKWTDYELSTSLMKTTITPDYVPNILTAVNQYENTEMGNDTRRNETDFFLDEFESTISPFMTSTTSHYVPNDSTTEKKTEGWISRNETFILSDTSNDTFLKEGEKNSSSSFERQLFNDCEKFLFFLRRMLFSKT